MNRVLGMFSPEIQRDTVGRLFDAAKVYGFGAIQFDFLSVCGEEMPARIPSSVVEEIRHAADCRGLEICAVNGTFNMIHPSPDAVERGIERFEEIARACAGLGCGLITLCTGTRSTEHMWKPHPGNDAPDAWRDLLHTMERLLALADQYDLTLGVETEASNVVNTPERARLLLDTLKSRRLKIIFDPANLFHPGTACAEKAADIVEHAFDLLKEDIVLAHAKDIRTGEEIAFTSAGRGIVPFRRFLELLDSIGYAGPVVAHGIHDEAEFPFSTAFLNGLMKHQI